MFKKVFILMIFLIGLVFDAHPLYRTTEGGRVYLWMMSPDLIALSMGLGGTEKPSGVVINPAGNAFIQNIKIEASYGIAPGLWSDTGRFSSAEDCFSPFMVNGGFVIPSRYGNFTGYLSYMNMSNKGFGSASTEDLDIGKIGAAYIGFSKDYSDNFAFGFSGNVKFSYNPDLKDASKRFDVGGGLDFGFIFRPEWYLPLSKSSAGWGIQDFQFALVAKELGKPLMNFEAEDDVWPWFPMPFTPGAGVSLNLYNNGTTYWKILSDVTAPFFQNITVSAGTEIQIMKFLVLKCSYTFDLEGVLEYTGVISQYEDMYNIFNFAGGLSFKFSSDSFKSVSKDVLSEKKHLTTEFSVDLGARPYSDGMIFEAGCVVQIGVRDTNPPVIKYTQKNLYASPNFDGVQDKIEIALDIKDERYIKSWSLVIYDETDKPVRTIASKEERKESLSFKTVMKRYFSPKTGIPVPEKVDWDGKDDAGNTVPDGTYHFKFFAMDDNKNTDPNGTAAGTIYIDTDKPAMDAEVTNKIFSPNNDGSKDTMIIDLDIIKSEVPAMEMEEYRPLELNKSTYELVAPEGIYSEVAASQIWYVDIKDMTDKILKTYTYTEKGKQKIEWDGKDDKGNQAPDGVYKVVLHSMDMAGNYYENVISNIIINTEPTPIETTINKGVFSPNADGINDTIKFTFSIPVKNGIERWDLDVIDDANRVYRTYSGEKQPPQAIEWDGKNEKGEVVKEGSYRGKLTVYYVNGNKPDGSTPLFGVDITPPQGKVTNFVAAFSPNGDGAIDESLIEQSTSQEEEWRGWIYDASGKVVKNYLWKSQAPKKFAWDGKNDQGGLLPDGIYEYQIGATDLAGNNFVSQKYQIKIDTEDVPLFISYSYSSFSPNGDGAKDTQMFDLRATTENDKKVSTWTLTVVNDREESVYTQTGTGNLPGSLTWDGKDSGKKQVNDGNYYAKINVAFDSGTASSAKSGFFTVDTVAPDIKVKAVKNVFSPNGDGNLDQFEILQTGSKEKSWEAYVYDGAGSVLWKTFYTDAVPKNKEYWDGKDLSGNILKNGTYRYVIKGEDAAGNTATASIDAIELKNLYTSLFLTLSDTKLSPNKDGKFDTIEMTPYAGVKTDIEAYTVDVMNEKGAKVKTFQGTGALPDKIVWDGTDNDGKTAVDGKYTVKMSALYAFGNMPTVETPQFILDTTPPLVKLAYSPEYFSPDNDNVDDELEIRVNTEDLTGINTWMLNVINPQTGKLFTSFSGEGKPASVIKWNGIGAKGDLVDSAEDYPVHIHAVDNAGNVLDADLDPIMVDILIIKQPDGRLKIKISNIEFKPNSAEMTESPKNGKVLAMLARALKKYNLYNITIEGHANKFAEGLDEVRARSLSDERAKSISDKLKALGISSARMTTIGKGFDEPLVPLTPNADKDELAKNRRVEFYLQK